MKKSHVPGSWSIRYLLYRVAGMATCISVLWPRAGLCQQIPLTRGRTLEGANVSLPEMFHRHAAIVVLGFSEKSSEEARVWAKNLYTEERGQGRDDVYGILMLERVPRLLRGVVERSIGKEIPPPVRSHYVALAENEQLWRDFVHATSLDEAYVVILAPDGFPAWLHHGIFSAQELASAQEALLKVSGGSNVQASNSRSPQPAASLLPGFSGQVQP